MNVWKAASFAAIALGGSVGLGTVHEGSIGVSSAEANHYRNYGHSRRAHYHRPRVRGYAYRRPVYYAAPVVVRREYYNGYGDYNGAYGGYGGSYGPGIGIGLGGFGVGFGGGHGYHYDDHH